MDDYKKTKPKHKDIDLATKVKTIRSGMKPTAIPQQRYLDRITSRILILAENIAALPQELNEDCILQTLNLVKASEVLDEVLHSQILAKE